MMHKVTSYVQDEENRSVKVTASISSTDILEYTYDERGYVKTVEKNNEHKLGLAYDGNGNLTLLKELTSSVYTPDSITFYKYDTRGYLTGAYSEGTLTYKTSGYDRNGYSILAETAEGGELLASYVTRADGLIEQVTDGAGNVTKYQYNQQKQVTGLTITAVDGTTLYSEANSYDKNGSLLTQSISGAGYDTEKNSYTYDALDRLLNETKNGTTTSYTYDSMGNRLTKKQGGVTTTYAYDLCNKLLSETTGSEVTEYAYDALGNLTAKTDSTGVTTHSYDAMNQLTETVNPDGTWQRNTYDASGIRSMIAENGVTTEFMTFNGLVLGGYNRDGEQTEHYYYGNSLLAVEYAVGNNSANAENDLYYYLKNSHGDVIGLTDNNGTLTETYRYDAFGTLTSIQSLNENGVLEKTETAISRFLYAGEQLDNTTGLYYLRARQYDTVLGRFTQEDTYLGDGRNLYVYVSNNPLKYVDPSGHCSKQPGYDANDVTASVNQYYLDMVAQADPEAYMSYQKKHKDWFGFWNRVESVAEHALVSVIENTLYSIGAKVDLVFGTADGIMSGITQQLPKDKTYLVSEREYDKGLVLGNATVLISDVVMTMLMGGGSGFFGAVTVVEVAGGVAFVPISAGASGVLALASGHFGNRTGKDLDRLEEAVDDLLDGKSGSNSEHMLGANGTQVSSKTTWKNGKTERIDVENPSPGERPGQIHYHDANNNKYYYDIDSNTFYDQKTGELAPKSIQKLLNDKEFMKGIEKALQILGE